MNVEADSGARLSGSGTVVLELGAGVGVLVLRCPVELTGAEIDISLSRPGCHLTHSVVRPRNVASGLVYAAVYPDLPPGDYTIWRADRTAAATVRVNSGVVTSAHWPDN
jgi:hypothetical protein